MQRRQEPQSGLLPISALTSIVLPVTGLLAVLLCSSILGTVVWRPQDPDRWVGSMESGGLCVTITHRERKPGSVVFHYQIRYTDPAIPVITNSVRLAIAYLPRNGVVQGEEYVLHLPDAFLAGTQSSFEETLESPTPEGRLNGYIISIHRLPVLIPLPH